MDTRQDEIDRGITIKSTAITMYFELAKDDVSAIQQKTEGSLLQHSEVLLLTWLVS